jgi:sec-independent protein translocase protein TatA
MGELLTPTHLTVIPVIAFVLFGGNKLLELNRCLGAGLLGFKDGIEGLAGDTGGLGKPAETIVPRQTNHCSYPS